MYLRRRGHHLRAASNGSGGGGCNSGGEHDALSDSLSHQSVQSASLWTAAATPANGGGNCGGEGGFDWNQRYSFFEAV